MKLMTIFFTIISVCNLFIATAQKGATNANSNYIFILDGSGSMWQKVDGEFKISIAKEVMKQLVDQLPGDIHAGLVVYGHREKSACDDIEVMVPLTAIDKSILKNKLESIDPKGKTPIAASIRKTLDDLKKNGQSASLVLVSDGLETCEGNACDIVAKARADRHVVTMHVVGFAIGEQDLSALECIAQAGGGQYISAENSEELLGALVKTVEAPEEGGGYLSVKVTAEGSLTDAAVKAISKKDPSFEMSGRTYEASTTNPRVLQLPAGKYKVEISALKLDGKPQQFIDEIVIVENDTILREIEFGKGEISILVTRNGELSDAGIAVKDAVSGKTVASGRSYTSSSSNPKKFEVLPGNYTIVIQNLEISGRPEIIVENRSLTASGPIELQHEFPSGDLKIGVQKGNELVDAVVSVKNAATGKEVAGGRTYQSASSNPKGFVVEPGSYNVQIKPVKPKDLPSKTIKVTVSAGKEVQEIIKY